MRIHHFLLSLCLICVFAIVNCSAAANRSDHESEQRQPPVQKKIAQIIIKFRDPSLDPSRNSFVLGLARDVNATLVLIRPMSGGAYVFRVNNISDAAELADVIQRLSKRPDVLYVEQDAMMHFQQSK